MKRTQNFRQQHDDMLGIATEISRNLNGSNMDAKAGEVRSLLSRLMGKLQTHLAMENNALYPQLLQHDDPAVQKLAQKFIDEMDKIGEAVSEYNSHWPSATKIQADPARFKAESEGLFTALADRINRENNDLYRKVDIL